jgi:hypothetical protein
VPVTTGLPDIHYRVAGTGDVVAHEVLFDRCSTASGLYQIQ